MLKYLFLASTFASLPNIVKEESVKISLPDLICPLDTQFKVTDNNFLTLDHPDTKKYTISSLNLQIKHLYESIKRLNNEISKLATKKAKYENLQTKWNSKKSSISQNDFKITYDSATSKYSLEKSTPSVPPDQDPLLINLVDFDEKMELLTI